MRKFFTLLLMFLAVGTLTAQQETAKTNQEPAEKSNLFKRTVAPTYKLAFSIYELQEGKKVNQRDYSMLLESDDRANKVKIGTKVPIDAGNGGVTYADVGLELECSVIETSNNKLSIRADLGVSNFAVPEQNSDPRTAGSRPVLRAVNQRVRATLTPGKPQIITSMDDVNSNKRLQVEVTATKVD